MLSLYSVLASKPWGRPENMKGTMGVHQKFRALRPTYQGWGGPLKPSVRGLRGVLATAGVLMPTLFATLCLISVLISRRKESSQPTAMDQ